MTKPRIALVIGSTRATRFADKPATWLLDKAAARDDLDMEILDLREFDLPLFDAPASNAWMPSTDPNVVAFQEKVAEYDGYIFMVAEYNHSITGVLKNAIDQAALVWAHKPMGAFGYGGVGAARAVEHLRLIAVENNMVPVRSAIHLAAGEFLKVHPLGANGEMSAVDEVLTPSAMALMDDIVWWAGATKAARAA
ncbi:NADPH-dependent FMN reductase [Sinisalibacter aestuarii]|uniref:FMN reductase n=1 Tax=Sinisalibacter aestuarii TaxID=2949426 RepID=A0ABQ5LU82_9RHOB|nr:NAD(P)H-dependent oxidoreductase [Sinisalibacter aestuarii]GKY88538.1 FMN reductase [Sinisalibacter aestuarii]